jgi:hypothetical protein
MAAPCTLLLVLVGALLTAAGLPSAAGADAFDVRRHLSTVTRYCFTPTSRLSTH